MTIWYAQGFVVAPEGPDLHDGIYGYDNSGFFGPIGSNLGSAPFLVQWTGTQGHQEARWAWGTPARLLTPS